MTASRSGAALSARRATGAVPAPSTGAGRTSRQQSMTPSTLVSTTDTRSSGLCSASRLKVYALEPAQVRTAQGGAVCTVRERRAPHQGSSYCGSAAAAVA